jgi:hypothetical protein
VDGRAPWSSADPVVDSIIAEDGQGIASAPRAAPVNIGLGLEIEIAIETASKPSAAPPPVSALNRPARNAVRQSVAPANAVDDPATPTPFYAFSRLGATMMSDGGGS